MSYEQSVIQALLKVVTHHECAVIADFGGFIVRRNPGLFNSFSGELKASTAIVYFNNEIKSDDGLVADALRAITGESFKTCQHIIAEWVKHLNNELSIKKNYSLKPLGNFHTNATGSVFFVSSPNFSIDPYSFGLPVFQWKWDLFAEDHSVISEDTIAVQPSNASSINQSTDSTSDTLHENDGSDLNPIEANSHDLETLRANGSSDQGFDLSITNPTEVSQDQSLDLEDEDSTLKNEDTEDKNQKPSLLWQIAATIAIISISISLYFTFSQLIESKKEKKSEEASMISAISIADDEETIVFVKEDKPTAKVHKLRYTAGTKGMDSMRLDIKSRKGKFFITGGAYITEKLALEEGLRWQKLGYDVCILSVKNSSLTKVVLGRFNSEKMASLFVENIDEMPAGTISVEELTFNW